VPLTLIVVDEPADAETLAATVGASHVTTYDIILGADDGELAALTHVHDVLCIIPGDAGAAVIARARDAAGRALPEAETVRIVACEAWPAGRRLALPGGLSTPGAVWAWLSNLDELGKSDPQRNGQHAAAASTPPHLPTPQPTTTARPCRRGTGPTGPTRWSITVWPVRSCASSSLRPRPIRWGSSFKCS
jgi:hypothetical protein